MSKTGVYPQKERNNAPIGDDEDSDDGASDSEDDHHHLAGGGGQIAPSAIVAMMVMIYQTMTRISTRIRKTKNWIPYIATRKYLSKASMCAHIQFPAHLHTLAKT